MSAVTLATVRAALATAVEGAGYKTHAQPLATVIPPAVVIVPDEPYLEANTLASGGITWKANYELIVAVAYLDPQGSLRQLEDIVVKVCQALPRGTELTTVGQPSIEDVGPSQLLVSRIPVSVRANLTAP
jgi:hypothetical protein